MHTMTQPTYRKGRPYVRPALRSLLLQPATLVATSIAVGEGEADGDDARTERTTLHNKLWEEQ